jgi:hypothetical protein
LVSTGDEILPEHLNLSSQPSTLELIDRQVAQVVAKGSGPERLALKALLDRWSQTL